MDLQYCKFLEICWYVLEDVVYMFEGFDGLVGVWVGCGMGSYFYWNVCFNCDLVDGVGYFLLCYIGNDKDFLFICVSYVFDLIGFLINVQMVCLILLVVIYMVCQLLNLGEVDMVLVGGVIIEMLYGVGYFYKENEILLFDGYCYVFDYWVQGMVFGSGVVVVVLWWLKDVIVDGDYIWVVIKGSVLNNDGVVKVGYLVFSVEGQVQVIFEVLVMLGVVLDSIGYVECYGIGIVFGDLIEVVVLNQVYVWVSDGMWQGLCYIGLVKMNIGYLDMVVGSVGLIKLVLVVYYGCIFVSFGYEVLNFVIDFDGGLFCVNVVFGDWLIVGLCWVGVNFLGVGGINVYVILEQLFEMLGFEELDWLFYIIVVLGCSKVVVDVNGVVLVVWLCVYFDIDLVDLFFILI